MRVINCEKLEKSRVRLTITVEGEEFEKAQTQAFLKLRRNVRINGFRPGKIPRKVAERLYGPALLDEAVNLTWGEAYDKAVEEQGYKPLAVPEIQLDAGLSRESYTFTAVVPVYPEVTLGQYKGLSAGKESVSVTDEDVEEQIQVLADRNTRLISVERPAQDGDVITINFEGFLNGEPFEGGKAEDFPLELGSHSMIPGFEEALVGITENEERCFPVTFPEDYHAEDLAGKEVEFQVTCSEIKEKDVPALDDEFAKDVSEFDTMEELRTDLRQRITEAREQDAQSDFTNQLLYDVVDQMTCDVPDVLVDAALDQMIDNEKQRMAQYGHDFSEYLQSIGIPESAYRRTLRPSAEIEASIDLAIEAIVKAEDIQVSEEEIEEYYRQFTENGRMDLETVKKYIDRSSVEYALQRKKAIAVVTESATVLTPEEVEAREAARKAAAEAAAADTDSADEKASKTDETPASDAETSADETAASGDAPATPEA